MPTNIAIFGPLRLIDPGPVQNEARSAAVAGLSRPARNRRQSRFGGSALTDRIGEHHRDEKRRETTWLACASEPPYRGVRSTSDGGDMCALWGHGSVT